MNILLTGASGFIGSHVASALQAAGHRIRPASRSNGLDFNRLQTRKAWQPHLENIEVVINCAGIIAETRANSFAVMHRKSPSALFRACVDAGVGRVNQISALGVDERAFTPYQLSKKAADDVLRSLPLDWFVLRPSLVYGRGGASLSMFRRLANLPLLPLVDGGTHMIQPVHVDDLVQTVLVCLTSPRSRITLDVVGAAAVSLLDWLRMMRRKAGKTAVPVVSIPFRASLAVAYIARYLVPLLHPDNLRMLKQGNVADAGPLADFLGRMPLDVEAGWDRL